MSNEMKNERTNEMPTVLISIKPRFCMDILYGAKKIEVRKTIPKLSTPFRVLIYCTKEKAPKDMIWTGKTIMGIDRYASNGKVIGEFICKKTTTYTYPIDATPFSWATLNEMCLDPYELLEYISGLGAKGKPFYGWNISEVTEYEVARTISELKLKTLDNKPVTRAPQSWMYVKTA